LEARTEHASADGAAWRHANIARVAWLIARAASRRTESRGGHRRADFPDRDDVNWRVHVADLKAL
ncbi:MAG: L-aspartate oxidase, partial [Vicinamibacteria bacterium]|nr:L-aspartate oxidase [Vicinamibacteria bacterium]